MRLSRQPLGAVNNTCEFLKVEDVTMNQTWSYFVFIDTVQSTEASILERKHNFETVKRTLEEKSQFLKSIDGQYIRIVGDEFKVEFIDPWTAIETVFLIRNRVVTLNDSLLVRVGLDAGASAGADTANTDLMAQETSDYYQAVARAKQVMEACPDGCILCSEEFLNKLNLSKHDSLEIHGPFFVKLKGFVRPIPLYSIGEIPPNKLKMWQGKWCGAGRDSSLGLLMSGGHSDVFASLIIAPFWLLFRNTGHYQWGKFWFFILNKIGRWLKWTRLDFHTSVGLADIAMLLRQPEDCLQWAARAHELAHLIKNEHYEAMGNYQKGHCLAHFKPTKEAESYLRKGYAQFEDLKDARMAGWSALYLGRCLRGLGKMEDAEDWILASFSIFASSGKHIRQTSYALTQMARLRAAQCRLVDAGWYLEQAYRHYPNAVKQAPDDAPWEDPLRLIQHRITDLSDIAQAVTRDPAQRLVEVTLASILQKRI
jgi:class 3 adenylate cyclase